MKLLLDECLPVDFRKNFPGHSAHTVEWAGFKGKKNGELIQSAIAAGYEVFLTVDQGLPREQAPDRLWPAIIVIRAKTNQLEDLLPAVPAFEEALKVIRAGETVIVP